MWIELHTDEGSTALDETFCNPGSREPEGSGDAMNKPAFPRIKAGPLTYRVHVHAEVDVKAIRQKPD